MTKAQLTPHFSGSMSRMPFRTGTFFTKAVLITVMTVMPLSPVIPTILAQTKPGQSVQEPYKGRLTKPNWGDTQNSQKTPQGAQGYAQYFRHMLDSASHAKTLKAGKPPLGEPKKIAPKTALHQNRPAAKYYLEKPETAKPGKEIAKDEIPRQAPKSAQTPQIRETGTVKVLETPVAEKTISETKDANNTKMEAKDAGESKADSFLAGAWKGIKLAGHLALEWAMTTTAIAAVVSGLAGVLIVAAILAAPLMLCGIAVWLFNKIF